MSKVEVDGDLYIFHCPHCTVPVEVAKNEVNCQIFRHGFFYKEENGAIVLTEQVNPHESKANCDRFVEENKIVGCGKPFRMVSKEDGYHVEICDYI